MRRLLLVGVLLMTGCSLGSIVDLDSLNLELVITPTASAILATPTTPASSPNTIVITQEVPGANTDTFIYIVEEDNTLWGIAALLYGDATRWEELYEANQESINDPSLIYQGQILIVPNFNCTANQIVECYTKE